MFQSPSGALSLDRVQKPAGHELVFWPLVGWFTLN